MACAKNASLFERTYLFLKGNCTGKLQNAINLWDAHIDPYYHGAWAKDCNLLYLFSNKNVMNSLFMKIFANFCVSDVMEGGEVLLRAIRHAPVVH